ncbi:hypothetical protein F2Q70_00021600 [Brassica cretica]|uniref:Uncharacterized protein n=1 Tax=Brassica cretica TaxID=69181 RepID=A0A8S9GXC7_BRACR|nr:hypothetical protein F2Q70_00021600 [Brassica cretica]KAF2557398.1 hypothetical protein F2Q68_00015224 [Brassica cretica]
MLLIGLREKYDETNEDLVLQDKMKSGFLLRRRQTLSAETVIVLFIGSIGSRFFRHDGIRVSPEKKTNPNPLILSSCFSLAQLVNDFFANDSSGKLAAS